MPSGFILSRASILASQSRTRSPPSVFALLYEWAAAVAYGQSGCRGVAAAWVRPAALEREPPGAATSRWAVDHRADAQGTRLVQGYSQGNSQRYRPDD